MPTQKATDPDLTAGRQAYERHAWGEAFERLMTREHTRREQIGAIRRHALARLRELRTAISAARQQGEHDRADSHHADLRTIVLGLWWLLRQERELVARLTWLIGMTPDEERE